jgi:hypothetical protein
MSQQAPDKRSIVSPDPYWLPPRHGRLANYISYQIVDRTFYPLKELGRCTGIETVVFQILPLQFSTRIFTTAIFVSLSRLFRKTRGLCLTLGKA